MTSTAEGHQIELSLIEQFAAATATKLAFALVEERMLLDRHRMSRLQLLRHDDGTVTVVASSSADAPSPAPEGWCMARPLPSGQHLGYSMHCQADDELLVALERCAVHVGDVFGNHPKWGRPR